MLGRCDQFLQISSLCKMRWLLGLSHCETLCLTQSNDMQNSFNQTFQTSVIVWHGIWTRHPLWGFVVAMPCNVGMMHTTCHLVVGLVILSLSVASEADSVLETMCQRAFILWLKCLTSERNKHSQPLKTKSPAPWKQDKKEITHFLNI